MSRPRTSAHRVASTVVPVALVLVVAAVSASVLDEGVARLEWRVVVNNGMVVPGDIRTFNSYNQPSVNVDEYFPSGGDFRQAAASDTRGCDLECFDSERHAMVTDTNAPELFESGSGTADGKWVAASLNVRRRELRLQEQSHV